VTNQLSRSAHSTPLAPATASSAFGRLGGPEAAAVARRIYADQTGDNQAEFLRVCYPLYSGTPGWAGESRQFQARMIKNTDVALYYSAHEVHALPARTTPSARCPWSRN
jgi:hypothetical protein